MAKIRTKFILSETDKVLFEIDGYLYNTKKNNLFQHDYLMTQKEYKVKEIRDIVNELSVCRNIYIKPFKQSTLKKS